MAMEGMDVGQIQVALSHIGTAVTNLEDMIRSAPGLLSQVESNWQGHDATEFQQNWPNYTNALTNAHTQLSDLQGSLSRNLQAQEGASNTY